MRVIMMTKTCKLPHIAKGFLTYVPAVNRLRSKNLSTGGTSSSRYFYAVWLRHLVNLSSHGFRIKGARVGELGPGESVGIGLTALLSGAHSYVGLDAFSFAPKAYLALILNDLVVMFSGKSRFRIATNFPT